VPLVLFDWTYFNKQIQYPVDSNSLKEDVKPGEIEDRQKTCQVSALARGCLPLLPEEIERE
jgi:hypothetical protein